ncbi:DUF1570 domain-containing protein [Porphyrobacter sp. GA68]|uniref:DUF1570 domain-containing protein n=1 Tax=Porphyrobacter sp. GA68 TaxID=2883480 RepID=UPI001D18B49F|nr:DUF1570 domain-containing protein [Porphyrobacter sp. GA68]
MRLLLSRSARALWPVLLLLVAAPLQARWHEAQTDHFVIYADDRPEDVEEFARLLESYHAALELLTGRAMKDVSPSNRLVIFAVGNARDLRRLAGGDHYLQGFYIPRAGSSRAYVQDVKINRSELDPSMQTLLHEYAHHFLISQSRFAMPRWMSEGAAEFFSSAQFPNSGNVSVGRPAIHRAAELRYAAEVPIGELLDSDLYNAKKRTVYDAFYGRAWLLYHYLFFSDDRKGQMAAYIRHLMGGMTALNAAQAAFGDLKQLDKDLDRYAKSRRMMAFNLTPDMLPPPAAVTVRPLSEGHAAVMPLIIRSQKGVNREEAAKIVSEARQIAARFPNDAQAQAALAEAEYDAGDDARAIAAADRAIALDPKVTNAYVQKGYALFRQAAEAENADTAYKAAMGPFTQLNRLENDHPLPLIYYYRSFTARGMEPTETARHALERAAELAPFDQGLWFEAGLMQASEGKIAIAISSLSPIAGDPHGGRFAATAASLIRAMEQAPEGEPFDPAPVLAEANRAAEAAVGAGTE